MEGIIVDVKPGICGFDCQVLAEPAGKRSAKISITGSGCSMARALGNAIDGVTMQDLFVPITRNKIFVSAEKAGCHLACPVPVALVKAAEAVLELALPKHVELTIEKK